MLSVTTCSALKAEQDGVKVILNTCIPEVLGSMSVAVPALKTEILVIYLGPLRQIVE
jgi:hypothetical protein